MGGGFMPFPCFMKGLFLYLTYGYDTNTSHLTFEKCKFENNSFAFLFGRTGYNATQFQFKNCVFSNNIVGTLNQSSEVFTNCTFKRKGRIFSK